MRLIISRVAFGSRSILSRSWPGTSRAGRAFSGDCVVVSALVVVFILLLLVGVVENWSCAVGGSPEMDTAFVRGTLRDVLVGTFFFVSAGFTGARCTGARKMVH